MTLGFKITTAAAPSVRYLICALGHLFVCYHVQVHAMANNPDDFCGSYAAFAYLTSKAQVTGFEEFHNLSLPSSSVEGLDSATEYIPLYSSSGLRRDLCVSLACNCVSMKLHPKASRFHGWQ